MNAAQLDCALYTYVHRWSRSVILCLASSIQLSGFSGCPDGGDVSGSHRHPSAWHGLRVSKQLRCLTDCHSRLNPARRTARCCLFAATAFSTSTCHSAFSPTCLSLALLGRSPRTTK